MEQLDRYSRPVRKVVTQVVPSGTALKDFLSGTWLGHPLHPALTDVVLGAWTSAAMLDVVGGKGTRKAAQRLVGLGILAAIPTAAAGLADWSDLRKGPQRVGIVHAGSNTTALGLMALSWKARRRGKQMRGRLYTMLGVGVGTASAWLGGHLSFGQGVGVNQTTFEELPQEWQAVIDLEALGEGKPEGVEVGGIGVLLFRHDGRIDAIADRCSHRGCSLHQGTVNGDESVTCPCHGSTFRLSDGAVLRGPATAPQPSFETQVREGRVEVRGRP
jgi:nitrite reductase/ring-hydroxylating ferredoxin subunit/uncharacterized membrane protein